MEKYLIEQSWLKTAPVLEKILQKIVESREAKSYFVELSHKQNISLEAIANAAGNHLFDDMYYEFNITEQEGHIIREHFQNYGTCSKDNKNISGHLKEIEKMIFKHFPGGIIESS